MQDSAIVVRELSPDLIDDFLAFFDGDAFIDNPDWAFCYCQCFYVDHTRVVWKERTAEENRKQACELIREKQMQGYLAYLDGRPIAWCNAAPWRLLTGLHDEPHSMPDKTGVIICFVVAEPYRGRGVATTLLHAACEGLREQGLAIAEAYPRASAKGSAENHCGPLAMYLAAGFQIHETDTDGSVCVRKSLTPAEH